MIDIKMLCEEFDKKEFKTKLLRDKEVLIDADGSTKYVVLQVNTNNFVLNSKFVEQLKQEGKYGYWVGCCMPASTKSPYSMEWLPVYGRGDTYVTKWLYSTEDKAIDHSLKDKWMNLLNRANKYEGNM